MVSLLLNLKSVTKLSSIDFITISQNSKLNIQNLMSVLERSLGSFRLVFHIHFKSMPFLKNLKAHFLPSKGFGATWPYLWVVSEEASLKVKFYFSEFIFSPCFPNMKLYVTCSLLLKASKKPTLSDLLWALRFCSVVEDPCLTAEP